MEEEFPVSNRNLQSSKAQLESHVECTNLFTSAASNQRVVQKIVHGSFRSNC